MIADVGLRHRHEIDIAVDAAHVPHILSFEIRTVAPSDYLYGDVVLALAHHVGQVKLGIVVAALRVTDIFSVYPNEGRTVNTVEVQQDALVFPVLWQGEGATVGGHGVGQSALHLNGGRIVVKGIVDIDIERLAVALHFEAGRYFDVVPLRDVGIVAPEGFFARTASGSTHIIEFPRAVKAHHTVALRRLPRFGIVCSVGEHGSRCAIRDIVGMAFLFVFLEEGLVFPVVARRHSWILHVGEGEISVAVVGAHRHRCGARRLCREIKFGTALLVDQLVDVVQAINRLDAHQLVFFVGSRPLKRHTLAAEGCIDGQTAAHTEKNDLRRG